MEFLLSSLLYVSNAAPSPIKHNTVRIAVLDSGYNSSNVNYNLCNEQYNFTYESIEDQSLHGEVVNTIIGDNLKGLDYCIIPIKVFHGHTGNKTDYYLSGLEQALNIRPDILNISAGATDTAKPIEKYLITKMLDKGIIIVAAAGNENTNLDNGCNYMPACIDKRIITVGWLNNNGQRNIMSNYGSYVKVWKLGNYTYHNLATNKYYNTRGTSMAAPVAAAEIAKKIILDKQNKVNYNN